MSYQFISFISWIPSFPSLCRFPVKSFFVASNSIVYQNLWVSLLACSSPGRWPFHSSFAHDGRTQQLQNKPSILPFPHRRLTHSGLLWLSFFKVMFFSPPTSPSFPLRFLGFTLLVFWTYLFRFRKVDSPKSVGFPHSSLFSFPTMNWHSRYCFFPFIYVCAFVLITSTLDNHCLFPILRPGFLFLLRSCWICLILCPFQWWFHPISVNKLLCLYVFIFNDLELHIIVVYFLFYDLGVSYYALIRTEFCWFCHFYYLFSSILCVIVSVFLSMISF